MDKIKKDDINSLGWGMWLSSPIIIFLAMVAVALFGLFLLPIAVIVIIVWIWKSIELATWIK